VAVVGDLDGHGRPRDAWCVVRENRPRLSSLTEFDRCVR
jgi:hypothetical protein